MAELIDPISPACTKIQHLTLQALTLNHELQLKQTMKSQIEHVQPKDLV
jgi:hypothetical protein